MALEHIHLRSEVDGDKMLPATWNAAQKGNYVAYANQLLDDDKQSYLSWYKSKLGLSGREFYVDEYPKMWETYIDSKVSDLGTVYRVAGNKSLEEILSLEPDDEEWVIGNVWNVDSLGNTGGVIPGSQSPGGHPQTDVRIGDQILLNKDGLFDNLRGFIDLSGYQTRAILSWDSTVTGLPTTVEDALLWLYTTQRYQPGTGISITPTTSGTKSWTIDLKNASTTEIGGIRVSGDIDGTKKYLPLYSDGNGTTKAIAPGFKTSTTSYIYFDNVIDISNSLLNIIAPSPGILKLNAPTGLRGITGPVIDGETKQYVYTLDKATASVRGGVKASPKGTGTNWTECVIGDDDKLYVPKADSNTDNTKINVGTSSLTKSSTDGVKFAGVGNTTVEIKNEQVEISSKMSVKVNDTTTLSPTTLNVNGGSGITVSASGTSSDEITITNDGVRSIIQDATNGHVLSINTGGKTTSITIPDNNTTYSVDPKNPTLGFGQTSTVATITPSGGTGIDLKVTLPAKPTDTTYDDYAGSDHGLVPKAPTSGVLSEMYLNAAGKWAKIAQPSYSSYKIVHTNSDGTSTTNYSNTIWDSDNPPGVDNHAYAGNLIGLATNGKLCRAVVNVANNLHYRWTTGNDIYMSGPEFEFHSVATWGGTSDKERNPSTIIFDMPAKDSYPAHKKYMFIENNHSLVNIALDHSTSYSFMTNMSQLSWRMRDGVSSLYNWEDADKVYTGLKADGKPDDNKIVFHRGWQNGFYGAFDMTGATKDNRLIYTSNLTHGWYMVPNISAETKNLFPIGKNSKSPAAVTNKGWIYDPSGIYQMYGTDGCFNYTQSEATIKSTIIKSTPQLLFYSSEPATDVTLMVGDRATCKLHIPSLTKLDNTSTTVLRPADKIEAEWNDPDWFDQIEIYVVIHPNYYFADINTWTYNGYDIAVYGMVKDASSQTSMEITGTVKFSQPRTRFITNYDGLAFVDDYYGSKTWRTKAWTNDVFTAPHMVENPDATKKAAGIGLWEDFGNPTVGGSWKEDSSRSNATQSVRYKTSSYFLECVSGKDHRPAAGAVSGAVDGDKWWLATVYEYEYTNRSTGAVTSKWEGKAHSYKSGETGTVKILTESTSLNALLNQVSGVVTKNQYTSGYQPWLICMVAEKYEGATGKVTDVQDDSGKTYLDTTTKIATLPTFILEAWNEDASVDRYKIFGEKIS